MVPFRVVAKVISLTAELPAGTCRGPIFVVAAAMLSAGIFTQTFNFAVCSRRVPARATLRREETP
jgi:hypothetical protein